MPSAHILLVDDDALMRRSLAFNLEHAGYRVSTAANAEDALAMAGSDLPDLVLLDIGLPGMDGLDALRQYRASFQIPVIFLTARHREIDQVLGLELGADDYVTKPFSFAEMVARVSAVLTRSRVAPSDHKSKRYASGDLVIDTDARRVTKGGKVIELTPTEYRLLATLAENSGRVLSHEQLLNKVWGYEFGEDTGYVKRYIWYLRRKIEDDPRKPEHILTERGFGYLFQGD